MPHIIIEYSANVDGYADVDELVGRIHQAALDDGLPPPDGLRTRAVARSRYRIADGDPAWAFVAVTARLGAGRTVDEKRRFLHRLVEVSDAWVAEVEPLAIALSVELQEIDLEWRENRNHVREAMARRSTSG